MKKNDCTRRGLLGLLLALCMTLLLLTPALAGVTDVTGGSGVTVKTTVVKVIPTFVWDFYFRGPFRLSDSFQLLCGISVFTLDFG